MATKQYVAESHNGVKVVFVPQDGILLAEFDTRIHHAKSDFTCFANDPLTAYRILSDGRPEHDLLREMLNRVFGSESGVERVDVKPYKLIIHHSRAADADDIAHHVRLAMIEAKPQS